jgi:folylpolyglutamate synthase/dihydropteroate synthase
VETVESVAEGLDRALHESEADDRIVVFGSFRTVAAAARRVEQRYSQCD